MTEREILEARRAYLANDERILEDASAAAEMTPEERLEETAALCQAAAELLEQLPDEVRERAENLEDPPSPEAMDALRRLAELS